MPWFRSSAGSPRAPLAFTLAAGAVILGARRPDLFRSPQFWAEDGTVFFLQAHVEGAKALVTPYAGYLHTALRLVAGLVSLLDPALAPAGYCVGAAVLTLYVVARTQSPRFPLPPSAAYGLAVVLVPDAFEVLLNLTNLQWVLAGGLLLVLIAREPERAAQRWHDGIAVAVLGLTGPFAIAWAPLFAWRAWVRRTRFSVLLGGLAGIAGLVQLTLILHGGLASGPAPVCWETLAAVPGVRVGGSLLSGGRWGAEIGLFAATALGLATLAGLAWMATRPGWAWNERRWLGVAFAGLLALALFRCRFVLIDLLYGAGSRYFFPLQLVALWLGIATVQSARGGWRMVAWGVSLVAVLANVPRLQEPAMTEYNWPAAAARIRLGEATVVRINPDWQFAVPGSRIPDEPPAPPPAGGTLVNLSTRSRVTAERPAIVGFALREGRARSFLLRAVGPSLALFGVGDGAARPHLALVRNGVAEPGFVAVRHSEVDAALSHLMERCRAFSLQPESEDRVALATLEPGIYSVVVSSDPGEGGEVLVEIYEVPPEVGASP